MNPTESSKIKIQNVNPSHLLRWLFSRNPFYILSAGMLLYAIYRLSIDPAVFASELAQLLFNFGSFQAYELLLVGTAIFLVRRKIGYDSALLVALETMLVLVPFILVSQALLIEGWIAALLCVGATTLAVLRFAGIRKYFVKVNFPPRFLLMGGVLLLVNLGLPLLVKSFHADANTEVWLAKGTRLNQALWMWGLPTLLAMAIFLPRSRGRGEWMIEKGYYPLLAIALWVVVTGAHVYSVGYVYGLKWSAILIVPVAWVAAWTLWYRFYDFDLFDQEADSELHNGLLIPAIVVPFFAGLLGDWTVFMTLSILNAALYGLLLFRHGNNWALHLGLLSVGMVAAALPTSVLSDFGFAISRPQAFGTVAVIYFLARSVLSRNPKLGLMGGAILFLACAVGFHKVPGTFDLGLHLGLQFILLHSMRWIDKEHFGAGGLRLITSLSWIAHAYFWVSQAGMDATMTTASFALGTLLVYLAVKLIFNSWGPRIVAYAAGAILLCYPLLQCRVFIKDASAGVLALVGSFLLFGFGTMVALLRNRVSKNEREPGSSTQIIKSTV